MDNSVRLFDVRSKKLKKVLAEKHALPIVNLLQTEKHLISCANSNEIYFWKKGENFPFVRKINTSRPVLGIARLPEFPVLLETGRAPLCIRSWSMTSFSQVGEQLAVSDVPNILRALSSGHIFVAGFRGYLYIVRFDREKRRLVFDFKKNMYH